MKNSETSNARLGLIASALIFGTIGLVKRYIPLPSSYVSLSRAVIGFAVLLVFQLARGKRPDMAAIKRNFIIILVSGAAIGFNWILLFEAYNYTSVAAATLCYYMAPLMVVLASPLLLKEKLSLRKVICVIIALVGMVLVNGTGAGENSAKGVIFGLAAAVLYASVMILNKKMKNIGAWDRTMTQMFTCAVVMLPYVLFTQKTLAFDAPSLAWALLILLGIFHTGFAYALYFGSMAKLKAQTVALLSYIDPAAAVLLSAVVLREDMGIWQIFGAVLIIVCAAASEIEVKKKTVK